jgi:hypothetical protein
VEVPDSSLQLVSAQGSDGGCGLLEIPSRRHFSYP